MQAVETLEEELSIPASRCWRTPSPLGQPFAGSISSSPSFDSGISSDTGMPSLLNVLPSQDFRRQLFKVRLRSTTHDQLLQPVGPALL